jgi:serine/threonine protein kinase
MMTDCLEQAVPKLIDFGLTKTLGPSNTTNEPFGTLGYVAPEVLQKKNYRFSCDLWSLGCIAYSIISGSLPFDHVNPKEIINLTINGRLEFDLPCWQSVSSEAKDFISKLLDKNPVKRLTLGQAFQHPWIKDTAWAYSTFII